MQQIIEIKQPEIQKIGKALSSKTRLTILQLISVKPLDVSQIAECLNQTEANISAQIKILDKAGLVLTHFEPDIKSLQNFPLPPLCIPSWLYSIFYYLFNSHYAFNRLSEHGVRKISNPACKKLSIIIFP